MPIPKIDQAKKASQYRPINMSPLYERVIELVVKCRIEKYLQANNIVTEHQLSFRKQYLYETVIQTVLDEWKLDVSESNMIDIIFMDLK